MSATNAISRHLPRRFRWVAAGSNHGTLRRAPGARSAVALRHHQRRGRGSIITDRMLKMFPARGQDRETGPRPARMTEYIIEAAVPRRLHPLHHRGSKSLTRPDQAARRGMQAGRRWGCCWPSWARSSTTRSSATIGSSAGLVVGTVHRPSPLGFMVPMTAIAAAHRDLAHVRGPGPRPWSGSWSTGRRRGAIDSVRMGALGFRGPLPAP